MKYAIILFEESQTICKAFRAAGIIAFSCDLQPCSGGHPEWHYQEDYRLALKRRKWGIVIAHPPCTYLTITGNKWFKEQPARKSGALVGAARRAAMVEAVKFFTEVFNNVRRFKCSAIENPVGVMNTSLPPDQIFQPYQFGHVESKRTCLWLKGLPPLKPTRTVKSDRYTTKSGKTLPYWYAFSDKKDRAKIRSKTFPNVALAMATQWGNL